MRRFAGGMSVTSVLSIKHWPAVIASRPAIILSSVDLPQPDGPRRAVNEPFSTVEAQIADRGHRAVALGHPPQLDMRRAFAVSVRPALIP